LGYDATVSFRRLQNWYFLTVGRILKGDGQFGIVEEPCPQFDEFVAFFSVHTNYAQFLTEYRIKTTIVKVKN
jgi:hypothetical protein